MRALVLVVLAAVVAVQCWNLKHEREILDHIQSAIVHHAKSDGEWIKGKLPLKYDKATIQHVLQKFEHEYHVHLRPGVEASVLESECQFERVRGKVDACPSFRDLYHTIQLKLKQSQ